MNKILYLVVVGFFITVGFLNLDGNEWQPSELPSFISLESGGEKLSVKEWKNNLIGNWEYTSIEQTEGYSIHHDGDVTFDSTYHGIWKLLIRYKDTDEEEYIKAGGTLETNTHFVNDSTWAYKDDRCNFEVVLNNSTNKDYAPCLDFLLMQYGYVKDDYYEYNVIVFNEKIMEFSRVSIATEKTDIYKFIRKN